MGYKHFTLETREILQRLLSQGHSMRSCARILGYCPSAICREVRKGTKNLDGKGRYDPHRAHGRAVWHRRRASLKGKNFDPAVIDYVRWGLKQYWSPEQICNRMRLDFPSNERLRISFKTIYRWLKQGVREQHSHPWRGYSKYLRLKRQGKSFSGSGSTTRGEAPNLPSIECRPAEANKRNRFGDWEGDLIQGRRRQGYLMTLVERSLGVLFAQPCRDKSSESVNRAILKAFQGFPLKYVRTITFDRGKEFYGYEKLQDELGAKIYFCHPHSPNERGQNEQANGLLRQFFPKNKSLDNVSNEKVRWAVALINNRPKKKYGYRTTRELVERCGLYDVLNFI